MLNINNLCFVNSNYNNNNKNEELGDGYLFCDFDIWLIKIYRIVKDIAKQFSKLLFLLNYPLKLCAIRGYCYLKKLNPMWWIYDGRYKFQINSRKFLWYTLVTLCNKTLRLVTLHSLPYVKQLYHTIRKLDSLYTVFHLQFL